MGQTQKDSSAKDSVLVFLEALTPLHPGVGRGGAEFVDLPVQKDEFGFPVIWSSSLKGAIKSTKYLACENQQCQSNKCECRREVLLLFGPDTAEASEYASAVTILDARLVLIPARTLKGVWTYVTSPHLLNHLLTYMEITRYKIKERLATMLSDIKQELNKAKNSKVLVDRDDLLIKCKIILNEVEYDAEHNERIKNIINDIDLFPKEIKKRIEERGLVVASDDVVRDIVKRSLIVQPRVRLNYRTKTVDVGPWEEEYLPQFTVFVTAFIGRGVRVAEEQAIRWAERDIKLTECQGANKGELEQRYKNLINKYKQIENIYNYINELSNSVVIFGGKEALGKGITRLLPAAAT